MRRRSRQRDVILCILRGVTTHPTAADIYESARKTLPNISLGTVYRNLALLAGSGEIMAFETDDGNVHYDATTEEHAHFCCNGCGRVYDINLDDSNNINGQVEELLDCSVSFRRLFFYGYCKNCKK